MLVLCLVAAVPMSGCAGDDPTLPVPDAGGFDAGTNTGRDAGTDAGTDAGRDAGFTPPDGGGSCVGEGRLAFCEREGKNCGLVTARDTCGRQRTEDCGLCSGNDVCGGGGVPNVCACVPESNATLCQAAGKNCDAVEVTDRCGVTRTVSCGTCQAPQTCGGGGSANVCACVSETAPQFCSRLGRNCGPVTASDNCGRWRTESCGTCTAPETCGGGSTANVCACRPEADYTFCSRLGAQCGAVTGRDNCGAERTVANCGGCAYPKSCASNVCASPPEVMAAPFVEAGMGWEWLTPLPYPGELQAVRVLGNGEVWVAGETGLLIRWDGTRWSQVPTGTSQVLRALWSSSDTDVWAVGDAGTVLRWNGSALSAVPSGTTASLRAVWGRGPQDVWVVANDGAILRWNGTAFAQAHKAAAALNGVVGTASGELWAVGASGQVLRFDGARWAAETSGTTTELTAVDVAPNNEVWAVGNGTVLRRLQGTWYAVPVPEGVSAFTRLTLWVTPEGQVRVGTYGGSVYRYATDRWTFVADRGDDEVRALHGRTGDDMWMVGLNGSIARDLAGLGKGTYDISSNLADSRGSQWLDIRDAHAPSSSELLLGGTETYWDSFNSTQVRRSLVLRWDAAARTWGSVGSAWDREVGRVWASPGTAYAVAISDSNTQVGVSQAGTFRSWGRMSACDTSVGGFSAGYTSIHGTSATDIWVTMGNGGYLCHRDSTGFWSRVSSGATGRLNDVWMVSASAGFAVGHGGVTLRYLGGSWLSMPSGTTLDLHEVWAPSESSLWVRSGSTLRRWNGSAWSSASTVGVKGSISHLWGTSDSDVWVTTSEGLAHWDGSTWTNVPLPDAVFPVALHGTSASHAFMVDTRGAVLRRRP
jgi:hypothetical protein